jgi:tripeptide aminopeptidase
MVNEKRLIESFVELVKIDSVSREEKKIADFLFVQGLRGFLL